MKKSIYFLLFIHSIVFVISCDNANDSEPKVDQHQSESYVTTNGTASNDGCKKTYLRTLDAEEIVRLKAIGQNQLQLNHLNSILNCAPGKISFDAQVGKDAIIIKETEEDISANCVCPYDLEYTITIPVAGKYQLSINGYKYGTFEFNANTHVELKKQGPVSL